MKKAVRQQPAADAVPAAEVRRMLDERRGVDGLWEWESLYYFKDKKGAIRKAGKGGLKVAQRKLFGVLKWLRAEEKPVRVVIGKSRKQGMSTSVAMDFLNEVMEYELDALIIAHNKIATGQIFKIYRRFYENYPLVEIRPALYKGHTNLKEMRFDGHDGHILVETAGNVYAGTGETPQLVHCSEVAKWERGDEVLVSLLQSIGDEYGTAVIHESTFNGEEPTFLPLWRAAYENSRMSWEVKENGEWVPKFEVTNAKDWNGYVPIFISVLDDESAVRAFESEAEKAAFQQTLNEYERTAVERYGASLEFVNWRRYVKKNKCQDKEDVVCQEYPITPEEAVRASGRPRFDWEKLTLHPVEDGQTGRLEQVSHWQQKVKWVPDRNDLLVRFREPKAGHRYVVGADISEGAEEEVGSGDTDWSVVHVYDLDYGFEQVAVWETRVIHPEDVVEPLFNLGVYYNQAYLVIESNGQGHTVCVNVRQMGYPESLMYHRDDWSDDKTYRKRALGHKTHVGNRSILLNAVAQAINDNEVLFHHRKTVSEHRNFVLRDGTWKAARGHHDDHVFAHGLAQLGRKRAEEIRAISSPEMQRVQMVRREQYRRTADEVTGY